MQFHEEFLTILQVKQNQDDLILRLDISDWFKLESYKDTVLELRLIKCQNDQKAFEKLHENIGELICNYEFSAEEQTLHLLMDNGDNFEVVCSEIGETKSDLTIDELFLKFQWLVENYQRESESGSKGWGKYRRLNDLLDTELKSEIQNWETKKRFFEQNESANTNKAETIIKLCNRMLNYINQIEKE